MKSGRFIGVMSGTSLDGVDVVLAAIDETMVAQQASLTAHSVHLKKAFSIFAGTAAYALATRPAGYPVRPAFALWRLMRC